VSCAWKQTRWGKLAGLEYGKALRDYRDSQTGFRVFGTNGPIGWFCTAMAPGPGVIVGRKGAYRGVHFSPTPFSVIDTAYYLKPKSDEEIDMLWAYFQLRTIDINRLDSGAAIPSLSREVFYEIPVLLPPIETQRRIASILGAHDDLIEVNRRRVVVLEEMARGLFEEWFIRFRFPGHEGLEIHETAEGPIPEGWAWRPAIDLVEFDPRTRVPKDGLKPFIPMGLLDTVSSVIAAPEARGGNSGAKFKNSDTLFARITPCLENGKTGIVRDLGGDGVGFGSTEFIVMRGARVGPAFTYCLSRLPAFRMHAQGSMTGASGRQRVRTDSVALFNIATPSTNDMFDAFEKVCWPMLELVGRLGVSTSRLAASRDLLLPRLISGQLSVEGAKLELEEAA
jgi:type I restriction enzyme S subunit